MNDRKLTELPRSTTPGPALNDDQAAALDEALDRAVGQAPTGPTSLKRQWDDELEGELEAAMAGFDPDSLQVGDTGPRTRFQDRAHAPKAERGREPTAGEDLRKGKVIRVKAPYVFVDLGGKSEGYVPIDQFPEDAWPEPGSEVEVTVEKFDQATGLPRFNLPGAAVEADWSCVRPGMIVEAKGTKAIKGGLEVEVNGMRGFLPIGQIDVVRVEDGGDYVNQKFKVVVTESDARAKNLVVSRRDFIERERQLLREKTLAELAEGQTRKGKVRSIKDFGAFIDLGGVDGLVHVSDLSWSRGAKVEDLLKIGDEVEVKVLKIDPDTKKIGLGLKQLAPSPWDAIHTRFARGMTVRGKVTRLMEFGAFVELEPGIEGLIHVSEMAGKRVFRVKDHVQPDQEVDVKILEVDPEAHRISLSLKQVPKDAPVLAEETDEEDEAPLEPKPERKVPLKGGLGDRDPNPFAMPPK